MIRSSLAARFFMTFPENLSPARFPSRFISPSLPSISFHLSALLYISNIETGGNVPPL